MISCSRSVSEWRLRQMRTATPHSSRSLRQAESSHPSGISPPDLLTPRKSARPTHTGQGVLRTTMVSARSRWMTGKPVLAARERENVLFPDPASPVTTMRRPIANAESVIRVSVPQVPSPRPAVRKRRLVLSRCRRLSGPEGSKGCDFERASYLQPVGASSISRPVSRAETSQSLAAILSIPGRRVGRRTAAPKLLNRGP